MEPTTPIETLCRIVLRGREYEAQTATDYDGGEAAENIDGENGEALSVLDDSVNDSVEEELKSQFDDLADDQLAEVLALCWVGLGTYDASDWSEAIEAATDEGHNAISELMDMPMLASVLESGMAAFELSCNGIGDMV